MDVFINQFAIYNQTGDMSFIGYYTEYGLNNYFNFYWQPVQIFTIQMGSKLTNYKQYKIKQPSISARRNLDIISNNVTYDDPPPNVTTTKTKEETSEHVKPSEPFGALFFLSNLGGLYTILLLIIGLLIRP